VPPPYKLWDYEDALRKREIVTVTGWEPSGQNSDELDDPYTATKARTLSFTHGVNGWGRHAEPTWQAILENGLTDEPPARKDSKYVTHGLHSYKGKFYPQLAKALINISGVAPGSTILDPFCGSGTTLLEAYLNGFRSYGCDLNPLATKLAGSKVGILEVDPAIVREAFGALKLTLENKPSPPDSRLEELSTESLEEIQRWFPAPVIGKLNWVLRCIRRISEGVLRDFLEIVLSSIIREVSQQAPRDLRIRRRKTPISDADVIGLFLEALELQYSRIERFWSVRGYAPVEFIPSMVTAGDSREASSLTRLGLERDTVDLILTSPPYATALPYIDTDRLSLLVLFGLNSTSRRPLEHTLIGSREILTSERRRLERDLTEGSVDLPSGVQTYINRLQHRLSQPDVGFRRRNMPALLARFFSDMSRCIDTWYSLLKPGGEAIVVIGDNRIRVDNEYERIATTDFLKEIASARGFSFDERIDISVTVDNHVHSKNSITENAVLRLRRPG
jgi:SAM-dependent methyltransferase